MNSGKTQLNAYTNGGTPGKFSLLCKNGASTGIGVKQRLTATSENCDPNLAVGKDAVRKTDSPLVQEESHRLAAKGCTSQWLKPDRGVDRSVWVAAGESEMQSKEVSQSAKSLPSVTKVSAPGQPGCSHRHYFCRSPRCASNNPDYSLPAQTTPRKYLVSKRHLLPGAICTRNPAILGNQTQEFNSQGTSSVKPPKPIRKVENVSQQPPFHIVPDREILRLAHESPPTRVHYGKLPSARPPELQETTTPLDLLTSTVSQSTSKARLSSRVARQCNFEEASCDEEIKSVTLFEKDDGHKTEYSILAGSDDSCAIAVISTSSCALHAVEESETSVSTNPIQPVVTSGGEPGSELLPLEKPFVATFVKLPGLRASDQSFFTGSSSSAHSSAELEDVTEKLAQTFVFEEIAGGASQVVDSISEEGISLAQDVEERSSKSSIGPELGGENAVGRNYRLQRKLLITDTSAMELREEHKVSRGSSARFVESNEMPRCQVTEMHHGVSKHGCREGRQHWRSDCRDSREVVFLKQTPRTDRRAADRMVDNILEGAISKMNPCGRGKVRVLVAAFENLIKLGDAGTPRRCASRVWCVNGEGKRKIEKDCEEFGDWDQRVNCYEVSEDGLQLRASIRLSVGVCNRQASCSPAEASEIEMSAIQNAQSWDDDCNQSPTVRNFGRCCEDLDHACGRSRSSHGEQVNMDECEDQFEVVGKTTRQVVSHEGDRWSRKAEESLLGVDNDDCHQPPTVPNFERSCEDLVHACGRSQSSHDKQVNLDQFEDQFEVAGKTIRQVVLQEDDRWARKAEESLLGVDNILEYMSRTFSKDCDRLAVGHCGCYTCDGVKRRTDNLGVDKFRTSRDRKYWTTSSMKADPDAARSGYGGGAVKEERVDKVTSVEPFHLLTEERGRMKEHQFVKRMEQMFAEEERLRNPIAQGLPWTTDEPEVVIKPLVKQQTRPVEFRHYSNSRAIERAEFDNYVLERSAYMEMERQEEKRLRTLTEQDEVKRLRREMVPRAQLMPFFDQPFMPSRSSKRLTVPKEPTFYNWQHKRAKCIVWQQQHQRPV